MLLLETSNVMAVHKMTLPLLNFVEVCKQTDLSTIFSKLNADLCAANMNTLNEFNPLSASVSI